MPYCPPARRSFPPPLPMAGFSWLLPRWARDLVAIAVALATTALTLILMARARATDDLLVLRLAALRGHGHRGRLHGRPAQGGLSSRPPGGILGRCAHRPGPPAQRSRR